jgi:HlyD family secretion protein
LERDRVNLTYAKVISPVDGVVVARVVNEGETVQANFQTPDMFTIAVDLSHMQIDINLPEADIGHVREGQTAEFTVDAYPDKSFSGNVDKVKISPTNNQGVVTYNVLVTFDNLDRLLLPGMTAYVDIITADKDGVLIVPNAALRYVLPGEQLARDGKHTVYVLRDGAPSAVEVQTGLSDKEHTEIAPGTMAAGTRVVTGDRPRVAGKQ